MVWSQPLSIIKISSSREMTRSSINVTFLDEIVISTGTASHFLNIVVLLPRVEGVPEDLWSSTFSGPLEAKDPDEEAMQTLYSRLGGDSRRRRMLPRHERQRLL